VKRAVYFAFFFVSFLVFLYLTFPFERFVESALCKRGIPYEKVEVERLPLAVKVEGVKYRSAYFKEIVVYPELLTLPREEKEFRAVADFCSGNVIADFDYPLKNLSFEVKKVSLYCLLKNKFSHVAGTLFGEGRLYFKSGGFILSNGKGRFIVRDISLKGVKFGVFELPEVKLGEVELNYSVKGKNYVELNLKGEGTVKLKGSGFFRVNMRNFDNSYLSLRLTVVLGDRPFNFRISGYLSNLRVG